MVKCKFCADVLTADMATSEQLARVEEYNTMVERFQLAGPKTTVLERVVKDHIVAHATTVTV